MNFNLTQIVAAIAFACGLVAGGYVVHRIEQSKINSMIANENKAAMLHMKQINDDNSKLLAQIELAKKENIALEGKLSDAINNVRVEIKTRTIWRNHEEHVADCAAWLDAVVPCKLLPESDNSDGKASAVKGPIA